jgi:hypothetical protein
MVRRFNSAVRAGLPGAARHKEQRRSGATTALPGLRARKIARHALLGCLLPCLLAVTSGHAGTREQAKRMHDRLTGVPATNRMLDVMTDTIERDGLVSAAYVAMDGNSAVDSTGDFYNVVVKNWATPWTNEARDAFAPLNDYSATVIGLVRDEADFREILYGDVIYRANVGGIPPYNTSNNEHYIALEASGANLGSAQVLVRDQQSSVTGLPATGVAGVITSRAAARAFFVDGTNRAMLRFTLLNHLCMDLEQLKDDAAPADRIRQDVSRSPGGDSSLFLNQCLGCHAGMDPLAQAFAYYDFPYPDEDAAPGLDLEARKDLGAISYTEGQVQAKHLINADTFSSGFVTQSDHWTNYWRLGDNSARIGWRNAPGNTGAMDMALDPAYSEGAGAASLGRELANSQAFSQCQVKKAFRSVCLRDPVPASPDVQAVSAIVSTFNNTHNMKQVFAEVAGYCVGHL